MRLRWLDIAELADCQNCIMFEVVRASRLVKSIFPQIETVSFRIVANNFGAMLFDLDFNAYIPLFPDERRDTAARRARRRRLSDRRAPSRAIPDSFW